MKITTILMATVTLALVAFAPLPVNAAAIQKVTASDGTAGDGFGAAMASTSEYVVVGAPGADISGRSSQGAAYVFRREDCNLVEIAKLAAADGAAGDEFGSRVAISKDMILAGTRNAAINGQPDRGAVYIFERRGENWEQTGKLFSEDGLPGDDFGASIGTDGKTILAGAPQAGGEFGFATGATYVFERERGEWEQVAELRAERFSFMEAFGASVAVHDELAVIGAPLADGAAGNIRVFTRGDDDDEDDGGWEQEDRIGRDSGASERRLGEVIVNTAEHFAIAAPGGEARDTYRSGVVYLYERDDDDLELEAVLAPSEWSSGGRFGHAVAMTRDFVAASAGRTGSVFLFEDADGNWNETAMINPPEDGEGFGTSLAFSNTLLLVGADDALVSGSSGQGAVFVYFVDD